MANEGLVKTFDAEAAVTKYRIVKFGSTDRYVSQAAAATDKLMGVSDSLGQDTVGGPVDVILSDIANVEYGGTVTRGDLLTSDANGKAVTAAPAQGINNRIIGEAMVSGVSGDIGKVLINRCIMQGQ